MKKPSIIIALLFGFVSVQAQLSNVESKLVAAYISSFHQKFEWPKGRDKGAFVIGVLIDSTNVLSHVKTFTKDKKAGSKKKRKIKILEFNSLSEISSKCHVLYLGSFTSYCDAPVKKLLKSTSGILLVTYDTECEEKMINIFGGDKLKFSIHNELLDQQKIKKL